jgi:hypothetical protein
VAAGAPGSRSSWSRVRGGCLPGESQSGIRQDGDPRSRKRGRSLDRRCLSLGRAGGRRPRDRRRVGRLWPRLRQHEPECLFSLPATQEGRCIDHAALRRAHDFQAAKAAKAPPQVFERARSPPIPRDLPGRGMPKLPINFNGGTGGEVREIQAIPARPSLIFLFEVEVGNEVLPGCSEPSLTLALARQIGEVAMHAHGDGPPRALQERPSALRAALLSGFRPLGKSGRFIWREGKREESDERQAASSERENLACLSRMCIMARCA